MKTRIALLILFLSPGPGLAATPQQLAHECERGFSESCAALCRMNTYNPQNLSGNDDTKARLEKECQRGFSNSCEALRGLNGEKVPQKIICGSTGRLTGNNYNGTTTCVQPRY